MGFASVTGVASIQGLGGNDAIIGSASADLIDGGSGNDTLNGGGGADVILGGSGNDALAGGAADEPRRSPLMWATRDEDGPLPAQYAENQWPF